MSLLLNNAAYIRAGGHVLEEGAEAKRRTNLHCCWVLIASWADKSTTRRNVNVAKWVFHL